MTVKSILKLFILAMFAAAILATYLFFNFVYSVSKKQFLTEPQRQVVIRPGESVKQISGSLAQQGVIASDYWFRVYVWLKGKDANFIAGNFILPEKVSSAGVVGILTAPEMKQANRITVLEGWSIRNIDSYLAEKGFDFTGPILSALAGTPVLDGGQAVGLDPDYHDFTAEFPFLAAKPAGAGLEGFLFPDTYEFYANAATADIIRKMLINFEKKITPDLLAEIAKQGKSFYEILIMASIIEREVPREADRAIVSDIFWSRDEIGMALQSDATLRYAIGGKRPALTSEELKIDSPYNSYKYRGLPPTPIGNPGLSAIRAAIYPADTDYFYFLSTPAGETIFSRTLDEHNAAKYKYLR